MEEIVERDEVIEKPSCARILATLATKVNLADFQNAVPVARELSILNETEADATNDNFGL